MIQNGLQQFNAHYAKALFGPVSCSKSIVRVKANHVRDPDQWTRPNDPFGDGSGRGPRDCLLVVQGAHKETLVVHAPLVVGMAASLIKGQGNDGCHIHPMLLEAVFQDTSVFDPSFLCCLLLHHWNLAMPSILRRHRQDLGKARQAIVEVRGVARPDARIQAAQHKPAKCGFWL